MYKTFPIRLVLLKDFEIRYRFWFDPEFVQGMTQSLYKDNSLGTIHYPTFKLT